MEQYKTKYARYKTEITNLQHIMILVNLPSRFTYSAPAVRQMDRSETGSRTFEPMWASLSKPNESKRDSDTTVLLNHLDPRITGIPGSPSTIKL
ncbi:hypothetical protein A1F94_012095 [Pyrenophora tritici-repentis]|nr:hypothetical protein A1F94_012095 [Pyrenophora tritici-repentis]